MGDVPGRVLEVAGEILRGDARESPLGQGQDDLRVQRVKSDKTHVYHVQVGGQGFYLKHYGSGRDLRALKNRLRSPSRSIRIAGRLQDAGVPSVETVGVVRSGAGRFQPWDREEVLITREIPGPTLEAVLQGANPEGIGGGHGQADHLRAARALGHLWARLLHGRFLHMDPTPRNFIVERSSSPVRLRALDLEDVVRVPAMPRALAIHRTSKLFFCIRRRAVHHGVQLRPVHLRGFLRGWRGGAQGPSPDPGALRAFFQSVLRHSDARWRTYVGRRGSAPAEADRKGRAAEPVEL